MNINKYQQQNSFDEVIFFCLRLFCFFFLSLSLRFHFLLKTKRRYVVDAKDGTDNSFDNDLALAKVIKRCV